jgi:hypothetical protein
MTQTARRALGIAFAAAVALTLGGCTTAVSTQSQAEACRSLETSMSTVTAGLNSTFSNLSTDPTAAVKKLQEVTDDFHRAVKPITNAKLHRLGTRADTSLRALTSDVKKALASPKTADQASLEIASNAVEKDFTAVGKACS